MPQLLKVPQLAHQHGVAEVQIGRGGIESRLHAQRPSGFAALFQALAQVAHANNLRRALLQQIHLFVYRQKRAHVIFEYKVAALANRRVAVCSMPFFQPPPDNLRRSHRSIHGLVILRVITWK